MLLLLIHAKIQLFHVKKMGRMSINWKLLSQQA